MNILIIKLSAIGDVVQTLPALEAIKKQYPEGKITWVVEEAAADILEGHPLIDHVLVLPKKAWIAKLKNPLTFFWGLAAIIRFIRELRGTRYDIAIDFQGLLKSGILIGLAHARRKIGFDRTRELSYLFLNERIPAYDIERHALERYLDVARYLGAWELEPICTLAIERESSDMQRRLAGMRQKGHPLIVINPAARWRTKLWAERNFAKLADRLVVEKHATVIFTGSPADREMIRKAVSMMEQVAVNWSGETTLRELAALARLSDLFITTDTGPMHLAAAAGAKVLALFGPTAPWRTGPHGEAHRVVRTGIECSPCYKRKCDKDTVQCMEGITVDDVMKVVEV
jgi:heptosyltransferase-1